MVSLTGTTRYATDDTGGPSGPSPGTPEGLGGGYLVRERDDSLYDECPVGGPKCWGLKRKQANTCKGCQSKGGRKPAQTDGKALLEWALGEIRAGCTLYVGPGPGMTVEEFVEAIREIVGKYVTK